MIGNPFVFVVRGTRIFVYRLRTQGVKVTLTWLYGQGLPKVTGIPSQRYSRITDSIYIGPQFNSEGKRKLEQWGIFGTVNMRIEFDDATHDLALEEYCYLPTVDEQAPTLEHLKQGVTFIKRIVSGGGKVYIHCAGGIGRAPTMAAAYFMSQGLSLDEALVLIKKSRPFINIKPPQMALLRDFEAGQ